MTGKPTYEELEHRVEGLEEEVARRKQAEEALQKERAFIEAVLNNIQDGIVACDADGVLTLFNRATREFHGLPQKKLPANKWAKYYDLYLSDGTTQMKKEDVPLYKALQGEHVRNVEMVIAPKSGKVRTLLASGQPLFDGQGNKVGAVVSMNDITQRKRTEEKLRRGEQRFRELTDSLPQSVFEMDETGRLTFANRIAFERFGYTKTDLDKGLDAPQMLVPKDRERASEHIRRVLNKESVSGVEYTARAKDGATFPVVVYTNPIIRGKRPIGLRGIVVDITDRKEAEVALRESEERYRRISEAITDYLYAVRVEGGCAVETIHSHACASVTGYTAEEFKANPYLWWEMVHEEDRRAVEDQAKLILSGVKAEPLEHRIIRKDGAVRWVRNVAVPRLDGRGRLVSYDGLVQDISERKQAEEVLKRQAQIIGQLHDSVVTTDLEGHITSWNRGAQKLYGYTEEEVFGKPVSLVFGEEYRDMFTDVVMKQLADKNEYSLEIPMVRKSGEVFYSHLSFSVLREADGEPVGTIAYALDITGRKRTEDALRESEARYRSVFNNTGTATVIIEEDMTIGMANAEFESLCGYPREEVEGRRKWTEFVAKDYLETMKWYHNARRGAGDDVPTEYESRFVDKHGRMKDILVKVAMIPGSKRSVASLLDITVRKQAEEALQESEQKYRLLVENQTDLVVKVNPEGRLLFVSPSYCEMFGKTEEELLGKEFMPLIHEEDRESTVRAMANLYQPPYACHVEHRAMTKDGWKWLAWADKAVLDEEQNVAAIVGVGRDITERKRLEAKLGQAQKMEAIGTLAGGIAHDFNNILSAIIGYTEMALENAPKGSVLERDLRQVFKAGTRATDLVKQILTFGRQVEHQTRPVVAKSIVKEALKLLRASLPSTIEIRQNVQSESAVLADPTQIQQVLMNLCTNASHAMQQEGGVLEVNLRDVELGADFTARYPDMRPGSYLRLTVSDTGHGMEYSVLERIFDPYFTTKEKGEGTGLGLSVVHGIVQDHSGTITVYSEPGKGATFHVYLPVIKKRPEPEVAVEESFPTGRECILFVDDEQPLVNLGRRTLESLGYDVVSTTNSTEALRTFQARPYAFDLVITDMTMPNMTGDKLAKEFMKVRPDIPVVLCTGFSATISEAKAKALGVRAFLLKPLLKQDVAKTVRQVLDQNMEKEI